jgi:hypothetical protein
MSVEILPLVGRRNGALSLLGITLSPLARCFLGLERPFSGSHLADSSPTLHVGSVDRGSSDYEVTAECIDSRRLRRVDMIALGLASSPGTF